LKSEHRVSSSKGKPRPTDPWCCDPTTSLDNRYISPSRIIEGAAPTAELGKRATGAQRAVTS
jgi:hypothetical protein